MTTIPAPINELAPQMTEWRHRIHAWPELGFEEQQTAALVAETLTNLGLSVRTGLGGTGVVTTIDSGEPGMSIGLRADMDALPMEEQSDVPFRSERDGVAHTCGHDGHTATLLGLAHYLSKYPPASGRVVLIFQPAEEGGRGAIRMADDGLFEQFHCDEVYAFHNMPLLETGQGSVRTGPTLQSLAVFEIEIEGVGGHAAAPHQATDPLQVAARLAVDIGAIVGRHIDPIEAALVNVGQLQAGSTHNIIPSTASLSGTVRALSSDVHDELLARVRALCEGQAHISGCNVRMSVPHSCPPCVNASEQADLSAEAMRDVLGEAQVFTDLNAFPFSDDFSYMLDRWPGAYLFLGMEGAMCHHPTYQFDDGLLPVAAAVFDRIVRRRLG